VACSCPRPDLLLFTVLGAKLTAGVWVAGLGAGESGRSRLARGGSTGLGRGAGGCTPEVDTTWSKSESRPGQLDTVGPGDPAEKTLSGMEGQV